MIACARDIVHVSPSGKSVLSCDVVSPPPEPSVSSSMQSTHHSQSAHSLCDALHCDCKPHVPLVVGTFRDSEVRALACMQVCVFHMLS